MKKGTMPKSQSPDARIEVVLTLKTYRAKVGRQEDPGPKVEIIFVTDALADISAIQWQLGREIKAVLEPFQPSLPTASGSSSAKRATTVDGEGTVIDTSLIGTTEALPEPTGEPFNVNGVAHDESDGEGDWRERTGLAAEPTELAPRAGRRRGTRSATAVAEPPERPDMDVDSDSLPEESQEVPDGE